MRRRVAVPSFVAALAAAGLLATGCAASSDGGGGGGGANSTPPAAAGGSASGTAPAADACAPGTLKTHTSGVLTVATDTPAYEPWFVDDKPSNGKGYESAVAYAVAKQLGYPADKVKWVNASFNAVVSPAPKNFDFDINQVSITAKRAKVVDFSSGYYDVAQAVVTMKSNKYAHVTSVAALKGAKLGAQKGSTSFTAITDVIKPSRTPAEYPTNDLAVQALKNGTIDGLVVDLPTGLYITAAQVDGSTIAGQLPVTGHPEQFGLVLDLHSPLTSCVTKAVDALRADGTLTALQKQWLTTSAGAPELK
ncbi:MAG TPA: ABC transporter substrate-binding protein [Jatrophihabitans sp.]|nr:ABC transporter substrate-binding protein [Jatrophihabitans sp.]